MFIKIGKFIQVYSNQSVANADLKSPLIIANADTYCFKFNYYIHGEYSNNHLQLELVPVSGSPKIIWSKQWSMGDMWHDYQITINGQDERNRTNYYVSINQDNNKSIRNNRITVN